MIREKKKQRIFVGMLCIPLQEAELSLQTVIMTESNVGAMKKAEIESRCTSWLFLHG